MPKVAFRGRFRWAEASTWSSYSPCRSDQSNCMCCPDDDGLGCGCDDGCADSADC